MEPLDFLSQTGAAETTPEIQAGTPQESPAQQDQGQPRDEHGRFAPATPPETRASPPPPPEPAAPPPGHVPVSALQEERARRQAAEELLRTHYQPPQAQPEPDFVDPYAYTQNAVLNAKLDLSEDLARGKYGDDAVEGMMGWFKSKAAQSPAFQQEVLSQRNPYEYAMQAHQREQVLSGVTTAELDEFKQWKAARSAQPAAQAHNPLGAPASPPVTPPPQSLAAAPSAAGAAHVPAGPGRAYDSLFKR